MRQSDIRSRAEREGDGSSQDGSLLLNNLPDDVPDIGHTHELVPEGIEPVELPLVLLDLLIWGPLALKKVCCIHVVGHVFCQGFSEVKDASAGFSCAK